MDNKEQSPFDFPCRFPIKVMGKHREGFPAHVMSLIGAHVDVIADEDVSIRPSSKGKFVSVTITFTAESREQLDSIYRTLTASERILFVL